MKYLLGEKKEMTRIFKGNKQVPVTLIKAGPCKVTQLKTEKKDGYSAVQVGFKKEKNPKKPQKGKEFKYLKEYKMEDLEDIKSGDTLDVSVFKEGEKVDVSGITKGKGFQGVVKRWNFAGRDATHGMKDDLRRGGSIGTAGEQRVKKGQKMPGRMGADKKTVKNLEVVEIDPELNILAVKGAVPGPEGNLVEISIS